jgi:replication fork clamp-binding protein CrfC
MANREIEDQDRGDQQEQSQFRGKGLLDYTLLIDVDAVVLTLHKQAPEVTDFLKRVGTYRASNGVSIQLGYQVQWKKSQNTIMLDSGMNPTKQINKPDITMFSRQPHFEIDKSASQEVRNQVAMFESAMAEFIDVVKRTYAVGKREEEVQTIRRVLN